MKDVTWINANGKEMEDKNWGDSACAALACCWMDAPRAPAFGSGKRSHFVVGDQCSSRFGEFYLASLPQGDTWCLLIYTNEPEKQELVTKNTGEEYGVTAHSLLLFAVDHPQQ